MEPARSKQQVEMTARGKIFSDTRLEGNTGGTIRRKEERGWW
jgi:hypothetical protein